MSDQELREIVADLARSQQQTEVQLAKTDAQLAKTDELVNRIAKMVGSISNNQGDVAEEFFINSIAANLVLGSITYDELYKNLHKRRGGVEDEYDIVLVNGKDVAIIEVKYKVHENDLIRLLNSKYPNFQKLYPEYATYRHHLALAGFHFNDTVKQLTLESGVMVLQRKGDLVETVLPEVA